jgi:hypothetical protein
MTRWLIATMMALLVFGVASAQDGDLLFEEPFESSRTTLDIFNEDGAVEAEFLSEDGEDFARIEIADYVWIEALNPDVWGDYRFDVRARIDGGTLYITGRSGENCEGYDLIYATDSSIAFNRITAECDYYRELGSYDDGALDEGEWVDFGIEMVGESLTVFVNGDEVITAEDDTYSEGDLLMYFQADGTKTATLDLADVRVTALGDDASDASDERGDGRGNTADETPSIAAFDGVAEDVMAELVAQDLVEDGGYVLFREDYAWFEGTGAWYTPLARQQNREDVVMAGELTFTYSESDEFQACGLMARVNSDANGRTTTQAEFGLTGFGAAYILDLDFNEQSFDEYYAPLSVGSGDSANVLLILTGGNATMFVDGEMVLENEKVDRRSGSFGIGLLSANADGRCEGRDIWVWTWE